MLGSPALAQDYGFAWCTIGDAGNRDTLPHETPADPTLAIGGVNYEYRMMRGKLTTLDYLEFVRAYAPFWQGRPHDIDLTGWWVIAQQDQHGTWTYEPRAGAERYGASLTWEMAARYANWLHNGKANEEWAFEDGAYDTSTFYKDDQGWHHQLTHHPDARFWIPTLDEYAKAVYYDPDHDGPGEGGYWLYPDGGDEELYAALPKDDGETIGEVLAHERWIGEWDLGRYSHVRSPWGLIDVSGTMEDWIEDLSNPNIGTRMLGGSYAQDPLYFSFDRLDVWDGTVPDGVRGSLRLAAVVPCPSSLAVVVWCFAPCRSKRK
jgi:hypothetical protein